MRLHGVAGKDGIRSSARALARVLLALTIAGCPLFQGCRYPSDLVYVTASHFDRGFGHAIPVWKSGSEIEIWQEFHPGKEGGEYSKSIGDGSFDFTDRPGEIRFWLKDLGQRQLGLLVCTPLRRWFLHWVSPSEVTPASGGRAGDIEVSVPLVDSWIPVGDDFLKPLGIVYGLESPDVRRAFPEHPGKRWDDAASTYLQEPVQRARQLLEEKQFEAAVGQAVQILIPLDLEVALYFWSDEDATEIEGIYVSVRSLRAALDRKESGDARAALDDISERIKLLAPK